MQGQSCQSMHPGEKQGMAEVSKHQSAYLWPPHNGHWALLVVSLCRVRLVPQHCWRRSMSTGKRRRWQDSLAQGKARLPPHGSLPACWFSQNCNRHFNVENVSDFIVFGHWCGVRSIWSGKHGLAGELVGESGWAHVDLSHRGGGFCGRGYKRRRWRARRYQLDPGDQSCITTHRHEVLCE